jgi:hypothetical protein
MSVPVLTFMGRNKNIHPDFQNTHGVQKFHEKHKQMIYDAIKSGNLTPKEVELLETQIKQHNDIIDKQPHGGSRRRAI